MNAPTIDGTRGHENHIVDGAAPGNPAANGNGPDQQERPLAGSDAGTVATGKEIKNPPRRGDTDVNGFKIDNVFASTRYFVIYEADNQVRFTLPQRGRESFETTNCRPRRATGEHRRSESRSFAFAE